ncbi:hypothetical protein [Bacillus testis]|uniref:hypothetical protein n=1 Tax=Bacillus testis TaxID=1622072 RepID=UPI000AFC7BDC|nr:hypothetical protein [Bacillus testis]
MKKTKAAEMTDGETKKALSRKAEMKIVEEIAEEIVLFVAVIAAVNEEEEEKVINQ